LYSKILTFNKSIKNIKKYRIKEGFEFIIPGPPVKEAPAEVKMILLPLLSVI